VRLIGNGKMGAVTHAVQKAFQAAIHRQILPSRPVRRSALRSPTTLSAGHLGAALIFGYEASLALWGSLPCTWALKEQQPQIKTAGVHKGYKY